jgi:thiol-disulfide isomerase/thioredoxin
MAKRILILLCFCFTKLNAQKVVNFDELMQDLPTDKFVVVNFWATWCGPCLVELPHFMEVNKEFEKDSSFEMILVSLDPLKQMDKVKKTIEKKNLKVKHYLLNDNARMNEWIPKLDPDWSGGIPATLFINQGKKVEFVDRMLKKDELQLIISKYKTQ